MPRSLPPLGVTSIRCGACNLIAISDIGRHVDQDVEIRGWLYNLRSKGKIAFLQLRDGTGRIQGVAEEIGLRRRVLRARSRR